MREIIVSKINWENFKEGRTNNLKDISSFNLPLYFATANPEEHIQRLKIIEIFKKNM